MARIYATENANHVRLIMKTYGEPNCDFTIESEETPTERNWRIMEFQPEDVRLCLTPSKDHPNYWVLRGAFDVATTKRLPLMKASGRLVLRMAFNSWQARYA